MGTPALQVEICPCCIESLALKDLNVSAIEHSTEH
jgi:hypothetical protein